MTATPTPTPSSSASPDANAYRPRRPARSVFVTVRGFAYHLLCWGDPSLVTPEQPALFMLHGWMDVGASFQFLVDELDALAKLGQSARPESDHPDQGDGQPKRRAHEPRFIVAPDWRGFGQTRVPGGGHVDTYWFPDYLADLEAIIACVFEQSPAKALPVDLLGHSMGGNIAMLYAGVRPERVRKLVNLEGFGMPDMPHDKAPARYRAWLDELADPASLLPYDSAGAVARRMQRNDPLLPADRAAWLASHWAAETSPGVWELRADPAHKQGTPTLYRKDEVMSIWRDITAPMLWLEGDLTDTRKFWGTRYSKEEFHERVRSVAHVEKHVVAPSGHMLHHDQPAQVAALLDPFLRGTSTA